MNNFHVLVYTNSLGFLLNFSTVSTVYCNLLLLQFVPRIHHPRPTEYYEILLNSSVIKRPLNSSASVCLSICLSVLFSSPTIIPFPFSIRLYIPSFYL